MRQRGFTLVEVVIVVAIVITVAAIPFGMSSGTRPMAMRSSVAQFDTALAYARAIAATSGNGATLLFTPRDPPGVTIAMYSGRPTAPGALQQAGIPAMNLDANVSEATLGRPPFALFVSSAGYVSMASVAAAATPAPMTNEPSCPAAGTWVLRFSDGRAAAADLRAFPCQSTLP